ncbi:TPA: STM3941 family protein, partial [Salmonella enterica subsp. enterica serovar Wangata]
VFFIILMIAGASAYWYSAFSGKPQLTLNQEGVTLHTTRLPIVYWHEINYVGERVSDNTPVLAIFVKDVELYCQRITNEKMRNNFLSLLNKHGSNRVMNISLNDLDYDSDELQDIFKMAVARNLEQ